MLILELDPKTLTCQSTYGYKSQHAVNDSSLLFKNSTIVNHTMLLGGIWLMYDISQYPSNDSQVLYDH